MAGLTSAPPGVDFPQSKRMTARIEGDFVVFLIGMRVRSWWRVWLWVPPMMAMFRILRELKRLGPEKTGCLGGGIKGPFYVVQYWRDFESLERYARATDLEHLPAWSAYNKRMKNAADAAGVWHETYLVRNGEHESVYVRMPPAGLGAATELVPATGGKSEARQRLRGGGAENPDK